MRQDLVYLDNSSTTFPKPPEVYEYMLDFYKKNGVSPGRACSNVSVDVQRLYIDTRKKLTKLFNCGKDYNRMVFAFNATDALNTAIQGVLKQGDHVVTSMLEHNSVLRPLNHLAEKGMITVDFVPFDSDGYIDPDDVKKRIKHNTKMVSVIHASNVIGTIQPLKEIGAICKANGVIFLCDASQTAGLVPIDMLDMGIDILAFTGHKSLYGPTGIGGLYVREGVEVLPTRFGGTGIRSEDPFQPEEYPHRLEAGTSNLIGIAGLWAGLGYIESRGMENIYREEMELFAQLSEGFRTIPGMKMYCAESPHRLPVLSVTIANETPNDISGMLSLKFNIATRAGLHCSPKLHEHIGTFRTGTVRFGIGALNTKEQIEYTIDSVREIADTF